MPPAKGDGGAEGVGERVERISGGAGDKTRADPFKQQRPNGEAKNNLASSGKPIVSAKSEPALQQKKRRDRARNQEEVVELPAQERRWNQRLDCPAINNVKRAGEQK